jgi:hypothetical protein
MVRLRERERKQPDKTNDLIVCSISFGNPTFLSLPTATR